MEISFVIMFPFPFIVFWANPFVASNQIQTIKKKAFVFMSYYIFVCFLL